MTKTRFEGMLWDNRFRGDAMTKTTDSRLGMLWHRQQGRKGKEVYLFNGLRVARAKLVGLGFENGVKFGVGGFDHLKQHRNTHRGAKSVRGGRQLLVDLCESMLFVMLWPFRREGPFHSVRTYKFWKINWLFIGPFFFQTCVYTKITLSLGF